MIEREPPGALQELMCIAWFLAYTIHTRCSTSHSRKGRTHSSNNSINMVHWIYMPWGKAVLTKTSQRLHKDFTKTIWQ